MDSAPPPSRGTVLVVDDQPENLRLLTRMLSNQGYQVRAVTSGAMTFKSIAISLPDIILLDITMPDMNGYEVCKCLKEQEQTADIPVIFVSALDEAIDKVKAFAVGGADYITKPFQIAEVLARVEQQLTLRRTRHALEASEARFRLFSENARDIIYRYRVRAPRGFDYISPSAHAITGYTVEEFTTDPDLFFDNAQTESRPTLHGMIEAPRTLNHPLVACFVHREGHPVWLDIHQWPVYDGNSDIVAVEGIARDITARIQNERQQAQVQQALSALTERMHLLHEWHTEIRHGLEHLQQQVAHLRAQSSDDFAVPFAQIQHLLQQQQQVLRDWLLSDETPPPYAIEQDFFTALEHHIRRFEQVHGIGVELIATPDVFQQHFAPTLRVHLLSIIKALLATVRMLAHPTTILLHCACNDMQVSLMLESDGAPLPALPPLQPDATAADDNDRPDVERLRSIAARASELGGTLTRETTETLADGSTGFGTGATPTSLVVRVPLERPSTATVQPAGRRVLLVDDYPLMLEGIRSLLVARGMHVVGMAAHGIDALEKTRVLRPDLILMDIDMPHCDGLEATHLIKAEFPDVQIVMLASDVDEAAIVEAIKQGASGYLLKNQSTNEFFSLLTDLEHGETVFPSGIASRVLEALFADGQETTAAGAHNHALHAVAASDDNGTPARRATACADDEDDEDDEELTRRQREVLMLVARGYTYQDVGRILNLSKHTVRYHMREIVNQLHVKNRADIIAYARKMGL